MPRKLLVWWFLTSTQEPYISRQDHGIICSQVDRIMCLHSCRIIRLQDHRIICLQDHTIICLQDHSIICLRDHWMMCLQVWRVAHPPVRGHHWMFTRPLVHVGFLKSWLAGGLNDKVVGRIMQLVHARPAGPHARPLKIYVTGTPTPAKLHDPCACNSIDRFTTHRL